MAKVSPHELTLLLNQWAQGEKEALDRLLPLVYDRLHLIAKKRLNLDGHIQNLQTTEFLDEAFIHLLDGQLPSWSDREHFFAFAAQVMRNILIDLQRKSNAKKRGQGKVASLEGYDIAGKNEENFVDYITLDRALKKLKQIDPKRYKIAELKFILGMTRDEIAAVLGISLPDVKRNLRVIKTWLELELRANQ